MRILTVFVMSLIVTLYSVLMAVLPHLWLIAHPWESPLLWGGAIVYAVWWGSIQMLTAEHQTKTHASGSGGASFVILAALGTTILMYFIH